MKLKPHVALSTFLFLPTALKLKIRFRCSVTIFQEVEGACFSALNRVTVYVKFMDSKLLEDTLRPVICTCRGRVRCCSHNSAITLGCWKLDFYSAWGKFRIMPQWDQFWIILKRCSNIWWEKALLQRRNAGAAREWVFSLTSAELLTQFGSMTL